MFLIGFPVMAIILLTEAMLQLKYLGTENAPGRKACLAVMFLYISFFQTIDGPTWIWIAEVLPTSIRAKGIGLSVGFSFVGFITFTAPGELEFKHIKWGTYLIYCVLCIFFAVVVYFYVPETKGLPIEEIGELFGDKVVVHLTEDMHGIKEKLDESRIEVVEDAERKV
jgi:Sugar (and other) transporter